MSVALLWPQIVDARDDMAISTHARNEVNRHAHTHTLTPHSETAAMLKIYGLAG